VCSGLTDLAVFILLAMLKSCFDVFQDSQQPPQQQQPQVQVQQAQPQKQAAPVMRRASSIAARQAAMAQQSQETKPVSSSPKIKRQTSARSGSVASTKPPVAASALKPGGSPKKGEVKPAADPVQTPTTGADSPKPEPSAPSLPGAEGVDKMAIDEASGDAPEGAEELDPALEEETPMEETIRVTRAKLRRRTATEDPAGN
jgi:receptor expression-enhancing protein 1/2/3/4